MDFHGLQSHFKGGIDGQLVQERLNEMAGPDLTNRLMITEFDVEEEDVEKRAEDVQDFLRKGSKLNLQLYRLTNKNLQKIGFLPSKC